jgi:membrane-bound lytic murein transglycosylase MltF
VELVLVPEVLEDEDLMEMLDAGVIDIIVVDDWKAKMWTAVLPHMIVNNGVAVRTGAHVGWAFRKNSPLLLAELNEFYYKFEKKRGTIPYRFAQYNKQVKRLQDPTGRNDWKRFEETVALFEKYGQQYGFDPLMLAAQGFQESKLDQNVRSPVGAIGIMQLMPATGQSMKVGDITVTEPNIHGGAKYMNTIMTKYFADAHFDELNRTLFAFAAYNAGPNRIAKLRKLAAERGLNPDVWFDNVEIVVSEKVGRETTTYVRNIMKYYVSYKLILQLNEEQRKARGALTPAGG